MMKKLILTMVMCFLSFSAKASSTASNKIYIEIGAGLVKLDDAVTEFFRNARNLHEALDEEIPDEITKYGRMYLVEAEMGYKFTSSFRSGLALRHYFNVTYGPKKGDGTVGKHEVTGLFWNSYPSIYYTGKFNVFVHGGLGISHIRSEFVENTGQKYQGANYSLGGKAGLGLSYKIGSNFHVQLKYDFAFLDRILLREDEEYGEEVNKRKFIHGHNLVLALRLGV